MRILIVGAGSVGGYFGGRLLEAKRDVTFLLRPRRAAQLQQTGLVIYSEAGELHLPSPRHVLAETIREPFDLVIVACKAYHLAQTMESFAPAVGSETAILPLLNGMDHLDLLCARFGASRVLGGVCLISSVLDPNGAIVHLNEVHKLIFGERDGSRSARIDSIAEAFDGATFHWQASTDILQEMWEKWIFIAAAAGITCLMRGTIGEIVAAGAGEVAKRLYEECSAIARGAGYAPRPAAVQRSVAILTAPGSDLTASMFRDMESGAQTEADQILGELIRRGSPGDDKRVLEIAYSHLKVYESRRVQAHSIN
jgi:2-dehydropantoate 2-reductase